MDTLHAANNVVLLDNTRKIEKLIHNNDTGKVVFNDICRVMSDILQAHILVISKKGKVLGVGECREVNAAHTLIVEEIGTFVDPGLNTRLLDVLSTHENVSLQTLGFFSNEDKDLMGIVLPIEVAGERLGTVFIYKDGEHFDIDDIILSEYGTTVVGLEMLRAVSEENAEENRKIAVVKSAISTLSYTEMHAIIHIFEELDGVEGILVASKIADKAGITRSVVVNALRKFESAGVIESRSSGKTGVLRRSAFREAKLESPDATLPSHPGQGVTSNGESKSQKIFAFYLLRNLTECAIVFKLQFLCLFIRHASQRMPVLFFKKGGRILNDRERARKNNHLQEEK